MADITALSAERRDRAGKGAARATRRSGRVPAVIYGNKEDAVLISIEPIELQKQLRGHGFFSRVFEIEVDGSKHRVLARDLQLDPVSGVPIHVDFMRFSAQTRVNVEVPVVFENEDACPGIKKGGVLNIVRHTIEVIARPDVMPDSITVDLTGVDAGESIHVSAVPIPADVELAIDDRDFTIATIAAPSAMAVEAEEEDEGEGEAEAEAEAEAEEE